MCAFKPNSMCTCVYKIWEVSKSCLTGGGISLVVNEFVKAGKLPELDPFNEFSAMCSGISLEK